MKAVLLIIIIFLAILYVFTFIRYKKTKNHTVNAVDEFNKTYLKKKELKKQNVPEGYVPYITKYNSKMDYVEKKEFVDEVDRST